MRKHSTASFFASLRVYPWILLGHATIVAASCAAFADVARADDDNACDMVSVSKAPYCETCHIFPDKGDLDMDRHKACGGKTAKVDACFKTCHACPDHPLFLKRSPAKCSACGRKTEMKTLKSHVVYRCPSHSGKISGAPGKCGQCGAPCVKNCLLSPTPPHCRTWNTFDLLRHRLQQIRLTLEFQDQPLLEVVDFLNVFMGLGLEASPEVPAEQIKVTLKVRDISAASALDLILTPHGLGYTHKDGVVRILPVGQLPPGERPAAAPGEPDPAIRKKLDSLKIDLDFAEAGLADIVEFIRSFSEVNIILDPAVLADNAVMAKRIRLSVRGETVGKALGLLVKEFDLSWTLRKEYILVSRR
jgi:hypothetical protein